VPTFQTLELFEEVVHGDPIPVAKLNYFRTRLRLQLHDLIVRRFQQQETMRKADLARRIHRAPEAINRLLGSPGNWTLDTVSDLLIGMGRVLVSFEDDEVAQMISRSVVAENVHHIQKSTQNDRPSKALAEMVTGKKERQQLGSPMAAVLGASK
jgi:hypothetical protein